jgi:DNA-binding MarR family transcriptional regulator
VSSQETLKKPSRDELIASLEAEMHAQSAWTVFYHQCVAERLGLNPTDHKCLDLVLKSALRGTDELMTPGQLARLTRLTTGAVTGVLDRLEQAGYVRREHDAEDRRKVIIRPVLERIHRDVEPIFARMSESFRERCVRFSDDDLLLLIDFSRCAQELLKDATEQLRALEAPPQAAV